MFFFLLRSAISQFGSDLVGSALQKQLVRIKNDGFLPSAPLDFLLQLVLRGRGRSVMRDINKAQRQNVVIPYFRVFSDNFKAIALKYELICASRVT